MRYPFYEKADGWSKGQPEVLVAQPVINRMGMPLVDHESLHEYLTDELGVPYKTKTKIDLYGRRKDAMIGGLNVPYTRSVHVHAVTAEHELTLIGGTMNVLAHELQHRADSRNTRVRTAAEIGARILSFKIGYEAAELVPLLSAAPLLGAYAARMTYYTFEPAEIRARRTANQIMNTPHHTDILFPDSPRTEFLESYLMLGKDTLKKLGRLPVATFHDDDLPPSQRSPLY